ncbi:MAG TPA: Rid family detoxifying hydrolase [Baekduia sp.]|jgi:2-iminobutanoate/2-iminopropanoate deaminase|nr:Rid family detoxifying hydrolase [Baekduia sp.]
MSADRQPITAPDAPAAVGPYSHAVRSDGFLFLSGQTPLDPATGTLVEGDVGAQTRQCLRNLEAVCAAAGASLRNAVRCGIFVTDMGTFAEVNTAYAEFFPDAPPARSTVGVAALPVGAQVEIDAIVALGD